MIKFFQRIRRELIDKGNLKRYLIYSVGEIILVVIGILIAVSLNNWNQKRIKSDEIEILLDKVEKDLIHNITSMNEVIQDYHINDSLTRKTINNELTIEDYYNDERLANVLYMINLLKLNIENIDKLIDNQEAISSKYETIVEIAKELKQSLIYNDYTEEPLKNFFHGNMDFLMSHAIWMAKSDSLSLEKRYHFFTTDEGYKKRVANYWAKTSGMTLTTIYHRSLSIELLGRIKVLRHNYDANRLHKLFKSLNLNSFKQINCEDITLRDKSKFYYNERFLATNMSEKKIHLVMKNSKGEIIGKTSIKPGEYSVIQETSKEFAAIDDDYFTIIELLEDGQCIRKYVDERNGYLIVE